MFSCTGENIIVDNSPLNETSDDFGDYKEQAFYGLPEKNTNNDQNIKKKYLR